MSARIQVKFAAFLSMLLLVAMVTTSVLILSAVSRNQSQNAETLLAQQSNSANVLLLQYLSAGDNRNPSVFFSTRGVEFASDLERVTGAPVRIFGMDGKPVDPAAEPDSGQRGEALAHALEGRIAYVTFSDSILYYAPLEVNENQMGVVRISYNRASDNLFYSQIRNQLVVIGCSVFVGAVVVGLLYFSRVARSIRDVNEAVQSIENGEYQVSELHRADEIGQLSRGVKSMGARIEGTLADKEAERQKLVEAVAELNRLDKEQKELLVAVSHELKTPLTAIRSYIDLVDMYPDDADLARRLKQVTDSETNRLYAMVQKVLRITEAENLNFAVDTQIVDMTGAVAEVSTVLSGNANSRGVTISRADVSRDTQSLDDAGASSSRVLADPDLLNIVISNLIDNAIKYNRPQGLVEWSLRAVGEHVELDVTDQGNGIPADHVERVFDPFVTVDKSLSRATGGSGLGLSVARRYAERMGGTLSIVRSSSAGSTFRLSLPRA